MIRILSSNLNCVASAAAGTKVTSAITNLGDVVPSTAYAKPAGFTFTGTIPSDLLVTQVLLKSTKNPENVYRIYEGTKIKLSDLTGMLTADAAGTPFSVQPFKPDHGLELEMTYENGTTAYNVDLIWKIYNKDGVHPGRGDPALSFFGNPFGAAQALASGNNPSVIGRHASDASTGGTIPWDQLPG